MDGQEVQVPYGLLHHLANSSNSNEERLKMLERRMTGELPSPQSLTFDGQHLKRSPDENATRPGVVPYATAGSDSEESDSTSEAEPSNKRPRLSSSPHKQDKIQSGLHASPFRQVTNHPRRHSSTAKRDTLPKHAPPPPGTTPPPSSKPHKTNTINRYFGHRDDSRMDRFPPVSIETQTDTSLQEQQAAIQGQMQAAHNAAEQARSDTHIALVCCPWHLHDMHDMPILV